MQPLFADIGTPVAILIGLGVLVVLALLYFVGIYNRLVGLKNRFKNAFAQIDVQLKRRYDLIPNLVETAKGYMKHERETLEAVVNARNTAQSASQQAAANPGNPQAMQGLAAAETALTGTMTKFMALMENYPDLKANQNMLALQEELTSTENKVAFSRQAYNDAVMTYNTAREVFPNNLVVGFGDFPAAELFQVTAQAEREAVKVQF
jgi:LemA protein